MATRWPGGSARYTTVVHDDEEARVIRSSRSGTISRRALTAVAAALIPMIAGCEAGLTAPSLQWHQPTDGTGKVVGGITISNAFVMGAPIGAVLRQGRNAGLFLGLVNTGHADSLIGITTPAAQSVQLPGGTVHLWSNHRVLLTGPRPELVLQHLTSPLRGGKVIKIVLIFQKMGRVTLSVPVLPRSRYFRTFLPAPAPTPILTATPSTSAKAGSKSPAASPVPSPSRSS